MSRIVIQAESTPVHKAYLGISEEEAEQLYAYTRDAYLDRNKYGALNRLLDRIAMKRRDRADAR